MNLPVLTNLSLDRNSIQVIKGLRGVKKLEELSLEGNLITNASMQDIGFNLVSLKELDLSRNKITAVQKLMGFPKIKKLVLDRNPLASIEHGAFRDCPDLESLSICHIKLPNYTGDLKFLRNCTNLDSLRMNSCFTEKDFANVNAIPDLFKMKKFYARDVGLIHTRDLHFKMPLLEILDLQDNRIYEVETIDDLANFTSLVEVNFSSNPLNVHANLKQMILDANPLLEIVNKRQVHDIGHRETEEIRKIRREVIEYEQPTIGTTLGDRLLAEGFDGMEVNIKDMRKQLHRIDEEHKTAGENEVQSQEDLDKLIKASKLKNELI